MSIDGNLAEMKLCTKCSEPRYKERSLCHAHVLEDLRIKRRDPARRNAVNAANRKHRNKNKAEFKILWANRDRRRREAMVQFYANLKSGPCTDCGRKFPACAMDFDHVTGEKRFNVGNMMGGRISQEKILEEVAKCELVCACCHRIRTHFRNRA